MKHSVAFQIISIALMAFQSFLSPVILGLEDFGDQILLIIPVLLTQSLVEPAFQMQVNKSLSNGMLSINLFSIVLTAFLGLGFLCAVLFVTGSIDALVLIAFFISYILYTLNIAIFFAVDKIGYAAISIGIFMTFYVFTFFAALALLDGKEILLGNLVGSLTATLFGVATIMRKIAPQFERKLSFAHVSFNSLSYRLPVVAFSNATTILLGVVGAAAGTVGEFRIFLAAINASRYFNLVPLAELQSAIEVGIGSRKFVHLRVVARRFLLSFACFAVGMTFVFPPIYDVVFGDRNFGRMALLISMLFVLVQPLSYMVSGSRHAKPISIAIANAAIALLMLAVFWTSIQFTADPYVAMGRSVAITLCCYAIMALNYTRGA